MGRHEKIERTVRKLLRMCRVQIWLGVFMRYFMILAFASGIAILALRCLKLADISLLYIIASIPAVAVLPAFFEAFRMKFGTSDVTAWLDRASDAGGLIMSSFENINIGEWNKLLDSRSLGVFHAKRSSKLIMLGLSVLFLGICFYMPIPERVLLTGPRPVDIKPLTEELMARVETLEEAGALDKERAEFFAQRLKELEENQAAYDPGKIFETIDSVDNALRNMTEAAAKQMLDSGAVMDDIRMLAEKLEASPNMKDDSRLRQMAEELSKMLNSENVNSINADDSMAMQDAMNEFMQSQPPTDISKLKALAEAMKKSGDNLKKAMKKLNDTNALSESKKQALNDFLDSKRSTMSKTGSEQSRLTREELERLYGDCEGCKDGTCSGGATCSRVGRGGVSRGRDDAPMIYAPNDTLITERGNFEKLESDSLNMKLGESLGVSFSAPEANAINDGAGGGLSTDTGAGGESKTQRLSPMDKKIVGKFFSENKAK